MGKAFSDGEAVDSKPHPPASRPQQVLVIGGGLGGLTAACHLVDSNLSVTLIEKRPFLGGRAYSFTDPETGAEVDNGQHVFLGCCSYYIDLLHKLGAWQNTAFQDRLKVPVYNPSGKLGVLSSVPIPTPLHLLPSLLSYPHLGLKDKVLALYAIAKILLTDRERSKERLEARSFLDWLKEQHQTQRAVDNLWNLIILPTLNDDVGSVSSYMGFMVFQEALLKNRKGGNIGYSKVGLSTLVGDSAQEYIVNRGGKLLLDKEVLRFILQGDRVTGVELPGGEVMEGDVFVSAVPWDGLLRLLSEDWRNHQFFAKAKGLSASPIVGIHIWYDRLVTDREFCVFLGSPVQWVFNKSLIQGKDGANGQYLCISLSGAWRYANMSKEELRALFTSEMARLFPKAVEAKVERFLVVKQLSATFRSLPGAEGFRLPQRTPISNLFLAGEWTRTGWPSTMESAVRSGVMAASLVNYSLTGDVRERVR